jgi:hypothetical protein
VSNREKLSFSERDKRRRNSRQRGHGGDGSGARSEGAQRRARHAQAMYRRKVEERLFGKKGDRGRLRLADRLREAHGTPGFHRTFREYLNSYGLPDDVALLMLLLDLDDERDVVTVLQGIEGMLDSLPVEQRSLLRKRLQNLEMSTEFDRVADATVALLERL